MFANLGSIPELPENSQRCEGFLVIEGFATTSEVEDLRERAKELVEGFDPATRSVFSTKSQVCSICKCADAQVNRLRFD